MNATMTGEIQAEVWDGDKGWQFVPRWRKDGQDTAGWYADLCAEYGADKVRIICWIFGQGAPKR